MLRRQIRVEKMYTNSEHCSNHKSHNRERLVNCLPLLEKVLKHVALGEEMTEYEIGNMKFLARIKHSPEECEIGEMRLPVKIMRSTIEFSLASEREIFPTLVYQGLSKTPAKLLKCCIDAQFPFELLKAVRTIN